MIKLVNKLLRTVGCELRRLPARPPRRWRISKAEMEALNSVLAKFAQSQPPGSDLADLAELRSYLSDGRISFFEEVLQCTRDFDVSLANCRVADVGCGTGYLLRLIDRDTEAVQLSGFDTFAEMNALARLMCPGATIHDTALQDIDATFDVIFCTEVLEHLIDPAQAVRCLMNCLSEKGALVVTVPDGRTDRHPAGQLREDGSAYWGHVHFWSPESWALFLAGVVGERWRTRTSVLPSGHNFGLISPAANTSVDKYPAGARAESRSGIDN